MRKVITSFNYIPVSAGKSISFTYSEIDDNGNITVENKRRTFMVMEETLEKNVNDILTSLQNRIVEEDA